MLTAYTLSTNIEYLNIITLRANIENLNKKTLQSNHTVLPQIPSILALTNSLSIVQMSQIYSWAVTYGYCN